MRRVWDAGRPVDLLATLEPLRRGPGDPAHQVDAAGRFWLAARTPSGEGTLALHSRGPVVTGSAWGSGGRWLLDRLPTLLGETDDWSGLDVSSVPVLHRVRRANPGVRLVRTGLVMDALVPAILEQKVTRAEAHRSWRQLLRRFGRPAPGPAGEDLRCRVRPDARTLLQITSWEWHRLGVDLRRQRTIRAAATVAARLSESAQLPLDDALERLRLIPGIGAWTAAETAQRALGHPDAISVGDYHRPNTVAHLFTGRARGTDAEMLELLAPWAGQRQRVMRLIDLTGVLAPRRGPRFAYPEIRGL